MSENKIKTAEEVIKLINELANIRAGNGVTGFDQMVIDARNVIRSMAADLARMPVTADGKRVSAMDVIHHPEFGECNLRIDRNGYYADPRYVYRVFPVSSCYSTAALAAAAKEKQ